jgi:biopolymer transport protein ExbB
MQTPSGLNSFWQNADAISHGIAYLLLVMSLLSWFIIFKKISDIVASRSAAKRAHGEFWTHADLNAGIVWLNSKDQQKFFAGLAAKASQAAWVEPNETLSKHFDRESLITRTMRQEINQSTTQMESGLTLLASVGSVAPFVGLFGTVWGIYHALVNIAASGQVLIDKIAGPVGEALIMTAAGLAVAIPAVLAYNALVRANRVTVSQLEGFAYDLLGTLTTGKRV